ncbi:MAG TPA: TonB-dependent receptor [Gemmatimonadaceae bacterium]|nr:TonB-dependent receptor [Gemmatimonadaceae bacterium]
MTRIRSFLAPFVAALATPGLLRAQAQDTARVTPMVTTATRMPVAERDVPASVTVITGAQLRALGIMSVADALLGTPSAAIMQTGSFGGATSLFLRGGQSDYVKVLIDGVPVNDPGGAIDLSTLTTDNVDRIEILRGPASVLYGADAVSGVVQIFTRGGYTPRRVSVEARGGTYHSGDASVSLRGGIPLTGGATAGYSLAVARHQTDGVYAFNNRFAETVVSGAANLDPDPDDSIHLTLRYSDSRYHYPTNSAGELLDSNTYDSGDRTVLGATYGRAFSRAAALIVSLTSDETTGGTTQYPDALDDNLYLSLDNIRRRSADARVNLRDPQGRGVLTLGATATADDEQSQMQGAFGASPYSSTFAASRRTNAAYVQALWTAVPRLTVVAGARVDDNRDFGAFGTYRAGVNYITASGTRLRASVGTAFRAPTFYENFSTGYVTGNPSLRPEHAGAWEAGVEQPVLAGRLTLGVTAFSQVFRDMIDYTGGTTACGSSYCNVARARAAGVEYEVVVAPVHFLSATFGFTHLDTRVLSAGFDTTTGGLYHLGQPLIRRPATSWNAALSAVSASHGSVDVQFAYVGRRADRDFRPYPAVAVTMPAYLRVDLGASYPVTPLPGDRGTTLTLRVQNLTGARYQSVFNFLAPGRTILAGFRVML